MLAGSGTHYLLNAFHCAFCVSAPTFSMSLFAKNHQWRRLIRFQTSLCGLGERLNNVWYRYLTWQWLGDGCSGWKQTVALVTGSVSLFFFGMVFFYMNSLSLSEFMCVCREDKRVEQTFVMSSSRLKHLNIHIWTWNISMSQIKIRTWNMSKGLWNTAVKLQWWTSYFHRLWLFESWKYYC